MKLIKRRYPTLEQEVFLRPDTSDEALFHTLIEQEEYGYIDFARAPTIIIDAGANIGLSAIYFANKYPDAKIYAIEPSIDNFEILKENINYYPNITAIYGALMGESGYGTLFDPGQGDLAYQVKCGSDSNEFSVPCMTMETICQKYKLSHIDLLKMDIEGSEFDIFNRDCPWLAMVDVLIIELHERIRKDCNYIVFQSLSPIFSNIWIGGENFYFARSDVARPVIPSIYSGQSPEPLPIEQVWKLQDQLDRSSNKFYNLLNPIYHRIDELEGLYRRVDELEGLYRRVDELEGLYRRVDLLEKKQIECFHTVDNNMTMLKNELSVLQDKIEELREKNRIIVQAPWNRLYYKVKKKGRKLR